MRILLCLLATIPVAMAADDLATAAKAILDRSCITCHGPEKQKSGLRLDSHAAVLKGGKGGVAVVPGDAAKSPLVAAVAWTDEDTRMPPKKKLSDADIATLGAWVAAGAPWPANGK